MNNPTPEWANMVLALLLALVIGLPWFIGIIQIVTWTLKGAGVVS